MGRNKQINKLRKENPWATVKIASNCGILVTGITPENLLKHSRQRGDILDARSGGDCWENATPIVGISRAKMNLGAAHRHLADERRDHEAWERKRKAISDRVVAARAKQNFAEVLVELLAL